MGSKKETLGDFELLVMLAVLRLGEDAYAVPIVDEIAERTGRSPSRSAVYLTIKRLEEAGLVVSEMGDPRPERGGKARRYVRVRPEGVRLVRETQDGLLRMWDGLEIAEADTGSGGAS